MKIPRLFWSVLIALAACAPATTPSVSPQSPLSPIVTPSRPMDIRPIQVDKVEVQIGKLLPAQVSAHVIGIIGDGCSSARPVEQQRDGNTLTLTINRQRPADAICTQIAKIYDETLPLTGDFPPGDYVLTVNGVTQTFTIK